MRVAAAGAAAIGLAGCGGANATNTASTASSTLSSTPAAGPPIARPANPRQRTAARKLARALGRDFRHAGRATGAYVYDITTDQPLFALRQAVKRPPASVEKLFTTVALINDLGGGARLRTTVLGTGYLGDDGAWHGNLYLRGGGDPTFGDGLFNRIWEHGYGPTAAQIAAQLIRDGIHRVTGSVIGDASLFDARPGPPSSGFAPDVPDLGGELGALTYDHGATLPAAVAHGGTGTTSAGRHHVSPPLTPGALAARELALTLHALHVRARWSTHTLTTPARARRLATVSSPPMSVMVRLMDVPSDDFFAEMLTKQLGARIVGHGSTAAGALAIASAIRSRYRVHPRIVDGSGLSRDDRASPAEVVDLLRDVHGTSTGSVLAASLPTVGVDGTVRTIAAGTPAAGRCVAKTGTLNGVTNLAGYCRSRGHQLLAFALFLDGPPNWTALTLVGRMVAAIATY